MTTQPCASAPIPPPNPPARRILAIWLARLAIDRWELAEGASTAPFALLAETAHGPRIAAVDVLVIPVPEAHA